jgi:hypothetical protein
VNHGQQLGKASLECGCTRGAMGANYLAAEGAAGLCLLYEVPERCIATDVDGCCDFHIILTAAVVGGVCAFMPAVQFTSQQLADGHLHERMHKERTCKTMGTHSNSEQVPSAGVLSVETVARRPLTWV